jgi:Domain of unknown function (DUF4157)
LPIGQRHDALEKEAEAISTPIMKAELTTAGAGSQMKGWNSGVGAQCKSTVPLIVQNVLRSPGRPLDPMTRAFMEPRFGQDFSSVRIHVDAPANNSADALNAAAYTQGDNIVFGRGQYEPTGPAGRRLIAHELTHVLQQPEGVRSIQRKPNNKELANPEEDPICGSFDVESTKALVFIETKAFVAQPKLAQRHNLVRTLKLIRRCASDDEQAQIQGSVFAMVGGKEAESIWNEAGTAFGGYTGMYPGYAADIKQSLKNLGVKETVSFDTFAFPHKEKSAGPEMTREYRALAKKAAEREMPDLARTDIVYFRGHQYAQYTAPGVFADITEKAGFDLRYIEKSGGFPNVKLMISTSCATLCREALNVFTSLFPNALILGFRRSNPKKEGQVVREGFQSRIEALNRPLLLDQAPDVKAIVSAWKSVAESIEGDLEHIQPGYYDGGVHYWNGEVWKTIEAASDQNKCKIKKDARELLPGPR